MEKIIAGKRIKVNREGFLTDFSQWNKEIADSIAKTSHIDLCKRHWELIAYLQEQFKKEIPMTVEMIENSNLVGVEEFYQLFPQGPLKTASKIAGLPKPTSCI
ncbi:MAG: TusE/DsrC/DsvC family sulfur relay protein [Gammaproteobacteria bacterium]|jgi:TusE/DsrC/DsvC family sulfur relay protein